MPSVAVRRQPRPATPANLDEIPDGSTSQMPRDALLKAYVRVAERRQEAVLVLLGLFDGISLGLLGPESLARLNDLHYERASTRPTGADRTYHYHDDDYNLRGLFEWEKEAVSSWPAGARVVVTSAGAGREIVGLSELGFDAVGFEPNRRLVEAGEQLLSRRGLGGRLHVSAPDEFPAAADGPCDAVLVGWAGYTYIIGRRRRVEFLRGARRRLQPGAPLVVSFFSRPSRPRYFGVVVRVANVLRRLRRAERVEMGDCLDPVPVHYFTQAEVGGELADSGFELVAFRPTPDAHVIAVAV
jgi:hypothetical protein